MRRNGKSLVLFCISGEESLQNNVQTSKSIKILITKNLHLKDFNNFFSRAGIGGSTSAVPETDW
jgi:hypothetical protein